MWHHVHNEANRRLGGMAAVNHIDNLKTGVARGSGAWAVVNEQHRVYIRSMGYHVDACEARCPEQKGKTERRVGDWKWLAVPTRAFDGLAGLKDWTDTLLGDDARRRVCPETGRTVAESWEAEMPPLRPQPALLPDPFDLARTATVHKDCSVRFEGHSDFVPFNFVGRQVEIRGCSGTVQVLAPQTAGPSWSRTRGTPSS